MATRCGACENTSTLHEPVTPVTQYATPELINAIAYEGHDPGADPAWAVSGAVSREEYARWCRHACGMACLRMVLTHRDGDAPPLLELLHGVRKAGGYVEQADGSVKGLIYAPFVEYVRDTHRLDAHVRTGMDTAALTQELDAGRMVIASVHKEIRRPERPAPGRGGHLVLVIGHHDGMVHFRNPSGHRPDTVTAHLPAERFAEFFAGRGIVVTPARR
ncbi:C39 family peptidase [Nocardiopsis sp. CT-R113]|uniref:C39 family peptidase n=1 Tax=Nocardiopsis codii TaxID=3065942 RepID=A0ABU7KD49_9ACTN|nr:C39 family peptidase [Nocardiopsis sp. CT-R113]MEE2040156.1 C39 family peptidase [Nocardiopsis sp. CT-R113]